MTKRRSGTTAAAESEPRVLRSRSITNPSSSSSAAQKAPPKHTAAGKRNNGPKASSEKSGSIQASSSSSSGNLALRELGPPLQPTTAKKSSNESSSSSKKTSKYRFSGQVTELLTPKRAPEVIEVVSAPSSSSRKFVSCLSEGDVESDFYVDSSPKGMRPILLRRALSIRELEDDSWLSSSLIDLVISKFSKTYKQTHFMSIDFVVLHLSSKNRQDLEQATDISGRQLNYSDPEMPIVFVCNSKDIHWNLIRVIRHPYPVLELFEPMGKPQNRHGGLGYRDVPRCVIDWLNMCVPLLDSVSWLSVGVSAITIRQQLNHYDCGTAVLLYAEKCGLGYAADEINRDTTQEDITEYRKLLQDFVGKIDAID